MIFAIISLLTFSFGPIEDVNLEGCKVEAVVSQSTWQKISEGQEKAGGKFSFDPIQIEGAESGEYKAEIRITNESDDNVFIHTGAAPLDVNGTKYHIQLPLLVRPKHVFSTSIHIEVM